jgi:hypothetical protein
MEDALEGALSASFQEERKAKAEVPGLGEFHEQRVGNGCKTSAQSKGGTGGKFQHPGSAPEAFESEDQGWAEVTSLSRGQET